MSVEQTNHDMIVKMGQGLEDSRHNLDFNFMEVGWTGIGNLKNLGL
jgi:hypothetical protein